MSIAAIRITYDLLLGMSERGAWRDWLLFFLRGVAEQAGDAAARAHRLQDLRQEGHKRLAQTRASALLLRLVDALLGWPVLTIPQAQRLYFFPRKYNFNTWN